MGNNYKPKMGTEYLKKLFERPEKLDQDDLLGISLSILSKNLGITGKSVSSATALSIYLAWLEAHRQKSSTATKHWHNTILHWVHALRARGYSQKELIEGVASWMTEYEDKNGRFRSYEHRYPPTAAQIAAGYEESTQPQPQGLKPEPRESKRERCESEEYNMKPLTDDKYMGVPAPNYICNRCGKKGHHLQACPTNMDPSFDRPPGDDYFCPVCRKTGVHYKSLCPLNTDRNCIMMKRKAAGITSGRTYDTWVAKNVGGSEDNLFSNSKSPADPHWSQKDESSCRPKKRKTGGILENWENERDLKPSQMFEDASDSKLSFRVKRELKVGSSPIDPPKASRVGLVAQNSEEIEIEASDDDRTIITKAGARSSFLPNLIASRGFTLHEIVNIQAQRKTAFDMWEEDDRSRPIRVDQPETESSSPSVGQSTPAQEYDEYDRESLLDTAQPMNAREGSQNIGGFSKNYVMSSPSDRESFDGNAEIYDDEDSMEE